MYDAHRAHAHTGAPPSYFDVAWEENEAYAPISGGEINIGDGSGYARGGSTAAATTAIRDRPAPATSATATIAVVAGACAGGAGDGAGGDWGGSGLVVPRWPALAEEHLSRLYSNDDGCRARYVCTYETRSAFFSCIDAMDII